MYSKSTLGCDRRTRKRGALMLTPILVLVAWTLIIWVWMTATRIPAMKKMGIEPQEAVHSEGLAGLPSKVRQVADNYNHLLEQPTIFYALAIFTHLAGTVDALNIQLAWAYVALRVVHSLIQCTTNIVMHRFIVFELSTLVLVGLTIRNILAVF